MAITITIPTASHVGTFQSSNVIIPALLNRALITMVIPDVDYQTAGNSLTVTFEVSADGGATWFPYGGMTWVSTGAQVVGRGGVINPQPALQLSDLNHRTGQRIRAGTSVPQQMSFGATITLS